MIWLASSKLEPLDPELEPEPDPETGGGLPAAGGALEVAEAEGATLVETATEILLVEVWASEVLVGSGVELVVLVVGSGVEVVSGGGGEVVVRFLVEVVLGGSQVVVGSGSGSQVVSGCLVVLGGSGFFVVVGLGSSLPSLKAVVRG